MTFLARPRFAQVGLRRMQARQARDLHPDHADRQSGSAVMCPDDCRELWCAVMTEAWRQAFYPHLHEGPRDVAAARRWFGGQDFRIICGLLDVDPEDVMSAFRRALGGDTVTPTVRVRE